MTSIWVIDEIEPKPGHVRAVYHAYMNDYAPTALSREMVLERSLISPPILLLGDEANRLTFIWSLAGIDAWWRMRSRALADPAVAAFWKSISPMITRRERRFSEEASHNV